MSKKHGAMTTSEYDACTVLYGADVTAWPAEDQNRVAAFLKTPEGLDAAALDKAFTATAEHAGYRAGYRAGDDEMASSSEAADFLTRLQTIPDNHTRNDTQSATNHNTAVSNGSFVNVLDVWLGKFFNPALIWSRAGFAAQGAMAAVLLMLGVFVGTQQGPSTYDDYDISAGLFEESSVVDTQEYSLDG